MKGGSVLLDLTSTAVPARDVEVVAVVQDFVPAWRDPDDLGGSGFTMDVTWNAVSGMNDLVVDAASVTLHRAVVTDAAADEWPKSVNGNVLEVTVTGSPRVRSLALAGLTITNADGVTFTPKSASELDAKHVKLIVALPGGSPLYAVPPVGRHGVMPESFGGADFDNGVLTLPDLAAKKVRITAVKDGFPNDVSPLTLSVTKVSGVGATFTSNVTLTDSAGATVWQMPAELPATAVVIDLRNAVEKVLKPQLGAGAPLQATFTLKGTGKAYVDVAATRGAILRTFRGVTTAELAGESVPLGLKLDAPLAAERPSRATANVTVKYHGVRLLEQFVDAVPATPGGIAGLVVGRDAVLRQLPPQALTDCVVAKVGIIGRAAADCELVAQFVAYGSGAPGEAVTKPAIASVKTSNDAHIVWLDIPPHDPIAAPVALAVRTNSGRFLWAGASEPLIRIAIVSPDPGTRGVQLGGSPVVANTAPVTAFVSTPPRADSLLFATVDVSDLVLEYDR